MSRIEPFGQKLTSPDDLGHHPDDLDIVRINLAEGPDADDSSRATSSPGRPEATPDDLDMSRMIRMPGRTIRLQHLGSVKNKGTVTRMIRNRIRTIRGTARMIRKNVRTIRFQPHRSMMKHAYYPDDLEQGPADPGEARMIWVAVRMIRLGEVVGFG